MSIYHERSRNLEDFLKSNDVPVDSVSRCHIGFKDFYHIEFNIPEEEYNIKISEKIGDIGRLLDVVNIGLVDFDEYKGRVHEVFIVDEDELHEKYLDEHGLLKF